MKNLPILPLLAFFCISCSDISKEKQPLVNSTNLKIADIDANHRVTIVEDDFHLTDSVYKVRGYFMDNQILKLVGVLHTPHITRDDYFYFENNAPIFSGHLVVSKDDQMASEYKYYYGEDGYVAEALFWEDSYTVGKRFPHEHFEEFNPDIDSLHTWEEKRLRFFMKYLNLEGFEIMHLNENLEANTKK